VFHPNFISIRSKNVGIANARVMMANIERRFKAAVKILSALSAIPTHKEFHHSCDLAVKQLANQSQQTITRTPPNQAQFVFFN